MDKRKIHHLITIGAFTINIIIGAAFSSQIDTAVDWGGALSGFFEKVKMVLIGIFFGLMFFIFSKFLAESSKIKTETYSILVPIILFISFLTTIFVCENSYRQFRNPGTLSKTEVMKYEDNNCDNVRSRFKTIMKYINIHEPERKIIEADRKTILQRINYLIEYCLDSTRNNKLEVETLSQNLSAVNSFYHMNYGYPLDKSIRTLNDSLQFHLSAYSPDEKFFALTYTFCYPLKYVSVFCYGYNSILCEKKDSGIMCININPSHDGFYRRANALACALISLCDISGRFGLKSQGNSVYVKSFWSNPDYFKKVQTDSSGTYYRYQVYADYNNKTKFTPNNNLFFCPFVPKD